MTEVAACPRRLRPLIVASTAALCLTTLLVANPQLPAAHAQRVSDTARSSWAPQRGVVYDIAIRKRTVFVAGEFRRLASPSSTATRKVRNVTALRRADGTPRAAFSVTTDGPVYAMAISRNGRRLFLGGDFSHVNGQARTNLAAVRTRSGKLFRTWHAGTTGPVRDLEVRARRLFVAGQFVSVGGERRLGVAVVGIRHSSVRPFVVRTDRGRPMTITFAPGSKQLYIGGNFKAVNDSPRRFLAAVDARSGRLLPWRPTPACRACPVSVLAANESTVFAGEVGAGGGHVQAFSANNAHQKFVVAGNGDVLSLALGGGALYIGGHFTPWFAGHHRTQIAAVSAADGGLLPFAPRLETPHPGVFALVARRKALFAGGGFTIPNSGGAGRFAIFTD